MVLLGRIELPTSPLPRVRSTTELQQRRGAGIRRKRAYLQALTGRFLRTRVTSGMSDKPKAKSGDTKEDRLKAALKANLQRRKAQARAKAGKTAGSSKDKD